MDEATRPRQKGHDALFAYLQENPHLSHDPSIDLADRFGVEPQFVATLLGTLNPNLVKPKKSKTFRKVKANGPSWTRKILAWTEINPVQTVFYSAGSVLILRELLTIGTEFQKDNRIGFNFFGEVIPLNLIFLLAIICLVLVFHMAVYFRDGRTRTVVYATGFCLLLLEIVSLVRNLLNAEFGLPGWILFGLNLVVILIMSVFYLILGTAFAVGGAYLRVKQDEKRIENLSRQQIIQRYFSLRQRYESKAISTPQTTFLDSDFVKFYQKNPWPIGAAVGFLSALPSFLIAILTKQAPQDSGANAAASIGHLFAGMFALLVALGMPLLSGNFWRGFTMLAASSLASTTLYLLPIVPFGPSLVFTSDFMIGLTISLGASVIIAAICAIGYQVQARTMREKALQEQDSATIMAEMLQLQWRLSQGAQKLFVVVVDAVSSTKMKSLSDPLLAEFCFREYQKWMAHWCENNNGTVINTMGDGAVFSFKKATEAVSFARDIQSDISEFNLLKNQLKTPFRVRIGIHAGDIAGELEEIEHNAVIDVAAHVEKASPVGSIALTETVAAELTQEPIAPYTEVIDGHRVFIHLAPIKS